MDGDNTKNMLLCSMGVMVGRINNFDEDILFNASKDLECDGFEFMIYSKMYEDLAKYTDRVKEKIKRTGVYFPVTHFDKELATFLSCAESGYRDKALKVFTDNCRFASEIGSFKTVLHLWGNMESDKYIDNNISLVSELYDISESYGLLLMIENTPCSVSDPLTHFFELIDREERACFVFDTRLSAFHGMHDRFLSSGLFESGRIAHVHVSDFQGPVGEFSSLRQIPHPGQGIAELDSLLPSIAKVYRGTITLESPSMREKGTDTEMINADLRFVREHTGM